MSSRLQHIATRRQQLIAASAAQREALRGAVAPWRVPLARVDLALDMLQYVQRHPVQMTGAGLVLLALRSGGRTGKWLGRAWIGWQMLGRWRQYRAGVVAPLPTTAATAAAPTAQT